MPKIMKFRGTARLFFSKMKQAEELLNDGVIHSSNEYSEHRLVLDHWYNLVINMEYFCNKNEEMVKMAALDDPYAPIIRDIISSNRDWLTNGSCTSFAQWKEEELARRGHAESATQISAIHVILSEQFQEYLKKSPSGNLTSYTNMIATGLTKYLSYVTERTAVVISDFLADHVHQAPQIVMDQSYMVALDHYSAEISHYFPVVGASFVNKILRDVSEYYNIANHVPGNDAVEELNVYEAWRALKRVIEQDLNSGRNEPAESPEMKLKENKLDT